MKLIRNYNAQVAVILSIVYGGIFCPSCTYKFHSFGHETEEISKLKPGDEIYVVEKNGKNYDAAVIEVNKSIIKCKKENNQVVDVPFTQIDYVRKKTLDRKTVLIGTALGLAAVVAAVLVVEMVNFTHQ